MSEHNRAIRFFDSFIEWGIICLIIFTPVAFSTVEIWSETVMELIVFLLALVWFLKIYIQGKISIIETPINILILTFLCLVVFQLIPLPDFFVDLISPNTKKVIDFYTPNIPGSLNFKRISLNPWETRGELLKLLTYVMIYFLVANNFKGKDRKNKLILCIIIIGFIEASYGIIQYVSGEKMIFRLRRMNYAKDRLISTFPSADHFSAYIKMCIFLSISYLIYFFDKVNRNRGFEFRRRRKGSKRGKRTLNSLREARDFISSEKNWEKKIMLIFAIIIMIVALIFTKSRGGILSFLVSIIFLGIIFFLRGSLKKHLWTISLIIIITLIFGFWIGFTPVFDRYLNFSMKEELEEGRFSIWKSTYNIFKDYPILGTGFGSFVYVFPSYSLRSNQLEVNHAHNDWLELLSDTGILGLLTMGSGVFYLSIFSLRNVLKTKSDSQIWIFLGGYTAILSIVIHSFVDFNLRTSANAFLVAVIIGMLASFSETTSEKVIEKR